MKPHEKQIAEAYRSMSPQEREQWLRSLSPDHLLAFYGIPEAKLYEKQLVPEGEWRYCLLRGGRGFGKSITGAAWLSRKIYDGARTVALYGPTFSDVSKVMVPNVISFFPPGYAFFNKGTNTIHFNNGAVCYCYTSEKENRGPNLEYLWVDEICIHADGIPEKIALHFDVIDMAVRIGNNPQTFITSTPKPFPWFFDFQKKVQEGNKRYVMYTGTMWDNPFLSDSYREAQLEKHGGTRLGRQELYGDLLSVSEGALWSGETLDKTRIDKKFLESLKLKLGRIVVAVDPAVTDGTKSDETGIVVVGMDSSSHVYVLADYSGQYSPNEWAKKVDLAVKEWDADCIVAEKNQGGQLVETNIRTVNRSTRVKLVHAKHGKMTRAEPVAALWEQGKAHMVGADKVQLENQMVTYDGNPKAKSPDRMDAMCYGVTELVLNKQYVHRDLDGLPFS